MRAIEIKRCTVINEHLQGRTPEKNSKQLRTSGIERDFIHGTVNRYKETGNIKDRPRTGHPRSKRTPAISFELEILVALRKNWLY
ncbi:hypothetical protein ILUMI_11407 [Ignelater luminosus]|uniref:Uncharacterized protein n=1 Tax=Ignelater luminosus TaxID=2038154 RepID=A0A8K0D0J3_IGNLU|nr:hypothetical protein ILUMI_11407 [Ignelater luminosus]